METFHELVDMPGFKQLSKDQQAKAYDKQMAAEVALTNYLKDFCDQQNEQHLKLGAKIDEASG